MSQSPHHSAPKKRQAGFTLIEFMIVTTLGILLMLTASSVFLTVLVSRAKTATQQRLKAEGDYAMGQMEFLIRNAVELLPTTTNPSILCTEDTDYHEIVVQSIDGGITQFIATQETPSGGGSGLIKIASTSATTTSTLTSSAVNVVEGPSFRCIDNVSAGNRYITVSFTLSRNNLEQSFVSSVNMRNY